MIHTFTGGADGSEPQADVVFDSAGNLYSASVYGGTLSAGNIFKLTKQSNQSWKETVLYNFTGGADGASPWDTPILDSAGHLYGTALRGGVDNRGLVFEIMGAGASQ